MESIELFLNEIRPNPDQPRKQFKQAELESLAESIQANGLLQPVVVYQHFDEGYFLIDGERRWRAAGLAGLKSIPAVVRETVRGNDLGLLAMVANLQREDLSPIEEAQAYQKMIEMGWSISQITYRMGISHPTVVNRLALLELEPEIQQMINADLLPLDRRATDALLSVADSEHRVKLAQKLARPGTSIKTIVAACEKFNAALDAEPAGENVPALHFSARKTGKRNTPKWDMLQQVGKVPPWSAVERAAIDTCAMCPLRDTASAVICGDCPAVLMVGQLIRQANNGY